MTVNETEKNTIPAEADNITAVKECLSKVIDNMGKNDPAYLAGWRDCLAVMMPMVCRLES